MNRRAGLRWLLCVLIAASCGGESEPEDALARPRNLLVVTIDTTRADALGCYGGPARTPRIDALAKDGVRFARCYAPAPLTLPSHATLFTGTLPPEHGVHENGRAPLGTELTTLAEASAARGMRTGAFVSALVLDSRFGLERGFQVYGDELGDEHSIRGALTVDRALAWLEQGGEEPFCAWVHLFDAHWPYAPPREHFDGQGHPYHGEVAYVDAQLGRLLDWLAAAGHDEDTLVVVTSDHGESLGQHGELTHSTLIYEATQRVPLVVSAPGYARPGLVVETPVHLVDAFASICEVFDWAVPSDARGRSFAPALRGEAIAETPQYMESEYARINFGWGRVRALVEGEWKYHDAPRPELYHLRSDPSELTDRIAAEPERAARMKAQLDELVGGLVRRQTGTLAPDEEMLQGMAALGYAQGAGAVAVEDDGGTDERNPADLIEIVQVYGEATGLCQRGLFAQAVPLLERAIEADPQAVGFRILLGVCLSKTDRAPEAIEVLRAALALDELQERAHFELAFALLAVGDENEAFERVERALEIRPAYREARLKLGEMLLARGQPEACLEQYQAVLDDYPLEDGVRNAAVDVLRGLGRDADVIAMLVGGIQDNPKAGPDWAARSAFELATTPDESLRDAEKALFYARAANQASGRRSFFHLDALAAAQANAGRFEAAVRNATEAARIARERGRGSFADEVEERLLLYRAGKPFRQAR